jgi:hypothetical protein
VGEHGAKPRAKQGIPPALRRKVLRRDHRQCAVPGCRHCTFLDLHHIETREAGGQHEADNLITLCGAHHCTMGNCASRVAYLPAFAFATPTELPTETSST